MRAMRILAEGVPQHSQQVRGLPGCQVNTDVRCSLDGVERWADGGVLLGRRSRLADGVGGDSRQGLGPAGLACSAENRVLWVC